MYAESGEWASTHPGGERAPCVPGKLLSAVDQLTGVRTPPPGGKVLDFGCGHGRWLNALRPQGWETFGIDPAIKTAFARHAELSDIPTAPCFQFVIASHVLEHLRNPGAILDALGRATVAGGWIYLSVPNLDRLPEHGEWSYVLNGRVHIAAYSLDCLRVLLQHAGFGEPLAVTLPAEKRLGTRLRIVARRGDAGCRPAAPLTAALRAIEAHRRTWRLPQRYSEPAK